MTFLCSNPQPEQVWVRRDGSPGAYLVLKTCGADGMVTCVALEDAPVYKEHGGEVVVNPESWMRGLFTPLT